MSKISLLDHGSIELVDYMGSDLSVTLAARVLAVGSWRDAADVKLLNYMWTNAHTSPFEHVTLTFHVKAPIFVFRQWHRHRTWSYNEVSARYKELPEEFYVPRAEDVGVQSTSNHQSRDQTKSILNAAELCAYIENTCRATFEVYKNLLAHGVPRELARGVLPLNTYSEMIATTNLLNLFRFLKLRCDEHAQYEIRIYADAMLELARSVAPECVSIFERTIMP